MAARAGPGMLLSLSHRFLFVHVNRTGGSSVDAVLKPLAHAAPKARAYNLLSRLGLASDPAKVYLSEHETAAGARRLLPREVFEQYFKFGFVRNPWDWLVSTYAFLSSKESHRHHGLVKRMSGFAEYVDFEVARGKRSQHGFLADPDGKLLVDFVGRFERLAEDFRTICARIGADELALPHIAGRAHRPYQDYYDERTRDLVARHWARDVELFEYEFEPNEPSAAGAVERS